MGVLTVIADTADFLIGESENSYPPEHHSLARFGTAWQVNGQYRAKLDLNSGSTIAQSKRTNMLLPTDEHTQRLPGQLFKIDFAAYGGRTTGSGDVFKHDYIVQQG